MHMTRNHFWLNEKLVALRLDPVKGWIVDPALLTHRPVPRVRGQAQNDVKPGAG
jgi:hypothetical protein